MDRDALGSDRKVLRVAIEEFSLRSSAISPCRTSAAAVFSGGEDSASIYLGTDSGQLLLFSWKTSPSPAALHSPNIRRSPRNSPRHSHSPSREEINGESFKSNGSPERQRSDLRLITSKSVGRAVEAVCVLGSVGQVAVLVDGQVLLVDCQSLESLGSIPGCKGAAAIAQAVSVQEKISSALEEKISSPSLDKRRTLPPLPSFDEKRSPSPLMEEKKPSPLPSPRVAGGRERALFAVAVKTRVLLYEILSWRQDKENLASPDNLPVTKLSLTRELFGIEGALALAWLNSSIFIGTSRDYILFTLKDSRATRLFSFPVESPWKPLLRPFPKEAQVLLVMDIAGIMVSEEGHPVGGSLVFTEIPDAVGQSSPYALVVNKGVVELYNSQTGFKVQSLAYGSVPVGTPCIITDDNDGIVVIANGDKVSCFTRISLDDQLKELLKQKKYFGAVKLANEEEGAKGRLGMVHAEAGFLLLSDLRFEEAMDHFLRSELVEPAELFPFFPSLSSRWRNMVPRKRYWGLHPPPQPIRTVIENGLYSLQNGLLASSNTTKQFQGGNRSQLVAEYLLKAFNSFSKYWETSRKRDLASGAREAVDTVLVRLYIELRATTELEALVSSCNHCLLEEVENLLRTSGQFRALAFLYESKNMLDSALQTWRYLAQFPEQSATLETARLLETCCETDLILRHVLWVIRLDEDIAFRILTSSKRTKALPAGDVLRVLEADSTMIRQRYLQWLIDEQGSEDSHIHTQLALSLAHSVLKGEEKQDTRPALLSFLEVSSKYDTDVVLDLIQDTYLWREQAILHKKQGNEKLTLEILALKLEDSDAAERYCEELGRPDAFMQLLHTYLGNEEQNYVKDAVRLLDRHGPALDPIQVLDALPADMPLHLASQALVRMLRARVHFHRQGQIEKNLTRGINFQTRMKRLEERSREIQVTGESVCNSCNARIGTKLFAVFPSGSIACYKTATRVTATKIWPPRGAIVAKDFTRNIYIGLGYRVYGRGLMHRVALHPGATAISPPFGGFRLNRKSTLIRGIAGNGFSSKGFSSATRKREDTRYGEEEYWNKRYTEEAFMTFDWYQRYADLQPILKKHIPKSARVLMAGCGNAVMSEDMVKDGYQNVVNVDYSSVLINALQFKYKGMPQLSYKTMDVRNMAEFKDNSFDAAIDKGLVDAMICATNGAVDVAQMLREMHRVLKPGGNFVMVTYGFPLIRMPALMERGMNWITNCWVLPKPYSGSTLAKYPDPIPMEVPNFIKTKQEDYMTGTNFVYVATKR